MAGHHVIYHLIKKSTDEIYDNRQQDTQKNHGGNRQIKLEVFFLHLDIPWQAAKPG